MLDPLPFRWPTLAFTVLQALLVLLPAAGLPRWAARFGGRWWSLVLPGSIAVVVAGLAVLPDAADVLTWLALVALPPLAAATLGWALVGRPRPWWALGAVPLLVVAIASEGERAGDIAALAITALSCVALGRLLVGAVTTATPSGTTWIRVGLVAMAAIDAVLVFSSALDAPNATLNAAVPAAGLPQLQYLSLERASLGYGDVFVAGVLGAVLAAEGASRALRVRAAVLLLVLGIAFDLLFWVVDTLPATVPVAAVALLAGGLRGVGPHAGTGPR
ncbi:hypothetical protein SK069_03000 [Patulibacter brassicae]|uniref:Prepilin peptidase n=1 Tax=Patulibacter brassicae TaxID=1705717 RepID=A0ABU4VFI5_9ACTN|nr:hypothetical protein [Patulibacter brassicae]MDX8150548.1 hypothetical protein [Patulibacter brassicae]